MATQQNGTTGSIQPINQVDVVIPVYNGLEFLNRLFATITHTAIPIRYIIVDDCSPDPRVLPLLEAFKNEHANNCLLIKNDVNLGFVKSVNVGLSLSQGHVVLVNTDTELPDHWLERLIQPIIQEVI